jgi:hypothetical protein
MSKLEASEISDLLTTFKVLSALEIMILCIWKVSPDRPDFNFMLLGAVKSDLKPEVILFESFL